MDKWDMALAIEEVGPVMVLWGLGVVLSFMVASNTWYYGPPWQV